MKELCTQELRAQCSNKKCEYQHIKRFRSPRQRALDVIDELRVYFTDTEWKAAEKAVVGAKLQVHDGKNNLDQVLSSLIAKLCPTPSKMPYYRITNGVDQMNVE